MASQRGLRWLWLLQCGRYFHSFATKNTTNFLLIFICGFLCNFLCLTGQSDWDEDPTSVVPFAFWGRYCMSRECVWNASVEFAAYLSIN